MLTSLAIHVESWVQEELAAQGDLRSALDQTETAAREGQSAELAAAGLRLQELLTRTGVREARRRVLTSKLASELGLAPSAVNLTRLTRELEARGIDTRRLQGLRSELRRTVADVVRKGRRLEAVASYHRGLFEELYQALVPQGSGTHATALVDEEG